MFDKCYHCGRPGHTRRQCPDAKRSPRPRADGPAGQVEETPESAAPRVCLRCGMPGHTNDACDYGGPADYGQWVARCRQDLHLPEPSEDDPLIESEFRRHFDLPLVTHGWARAEAVRQVEELRAIRIDTYGPAVTSDTPS